MSLERPRTVAQARQRAGHPPDRLPEPARRLDGVHLLAAAVGALAGLVLYSAVVAGLGEPPPVPPRASATR